MYFLVKTYLKNNNQLNNHEFKCSVCDEVLQIVNQDYFSFYVQFIKQKSKNFKLEKFVCNDCVKLLKKAHKFNYSDAPLVLKAAIKENLRKLKITNPTIL